MALTTGLRTSLGQRLALTPAMRMSLSLLRMPTDSLREEIAREAAENPFLVIEESSGHPGGYDDAIAAAVAPVGLLDSLTRQIATLRLDAVVEAAALCIAAELREDGYLDLSLDDLATTIGVPPDVLDAGLAAVQACDPPGVGARSLRECLSLQLADQGMQPALARAIVAALDDFAEGRWAKLSRGLALPRSEVERIAGIIRSLTPVPVQAQVLPVMTRIPDLIVECTPQGHLTVHPNAAALPALSVMQLSRDDAFAKPLAALFDRARGFVAAVAMRGETLLRIGRHITAAQPAFFIGGHDALSPLSRADVAAELGLNPSTVGRAVWDKSLASGGKVYPLSLFFSRALPGPDGSVSTFDVQARIRSLIAAEDAARPLPDDAITAQLQDEGVDIARRTVAKYRKCMRIPSSFHRRRRTVPPKDRPPPARWKDAAPN